MGNGRFFNFDTLKYLKNGLVIEKFNYGLDIKKGIVIMVIIILDVIYIKLNICI